MIARALITIVLLTTATNASSNDEKREYGEYLAGECTTCHRIDGQDNGIPGIIGWDVNLFIETLGYYRNGQRSNLAMTSVAKSLDEEQIHALAIYFASLTARPN